MANHGIMWTYIHTESENVQPMAVSSLWMLKAVVVAARNDRVVVWQTFDSQSKLSRRGGIYGRFEH